MQPSAESVGPNQNGTAPGSARHRWMTTLAMLVLGSALSLCGYGQLVVTPGMTVNTVAGTGAIGYSGDGGAATAATLAAPAAVARDGSGNLYLADSRNHVIRRIATDGTISTVAGTGIAGFAGDGGAATAAQLDTPTGIAVDAVGTLYIADSHNRRIRRVSNGVISTLAGTGTNGFSGDGASASAAALSLPSAIALDASGNLYVADTDNQRIRKITAGVISTVAGDGEQGFSGDGAAATAAALDSPTGIAIDATGVLYIADRNNQRIRSVDAGGIIHTLAGSGTGSFAGGFSGDGGSSAGATLSKPTGVSIGVNGSVFIADTNNHRIRQLGNGGIVTAVGTGMQGFAGDGGAAAAALLNAPSALNVDPAGNVTVADRGNQRIRNSAPPTLTFAGTAVGSMSAGQIITLNNTGVASLTVSQLGLPVGFAQIAGGTCTSPPILIPANSSCALNIAYVPVESGAASGALTLSGLNVPTQTVLLSGGPATSTGANLTLTTSASTALVGQPLVFSASGQSLPGVAPPTGTITFTANGQTIGTATLVNGSATFSTTFATAGNYTVTATYSGDANYSASTASVSELATDFNIRLNSVTAGNGTASGLTATVIPGGSARYALVFQPSTSSFPFPIKLTVDGLPPNATASFDVSTFTLNGSPQAVTLTIQTATLAAVLHGMDGSLALAVLVLPLAGPLRRRMGRSGPLCAMTLFGGMLIMSTLAGCGSGTGFFGQPQSTYNITVTATATAPDGTNLQHSTVVTLTVQ